MRKIIPWIAAIMGLGAVANGIYMLMSPANWYFAVPGVTTSGSFNQHFIRDIGMTYAFVGAALIAGAWMKALRTVPWAAASAWLSAHALFHLWEVAVGICGPSKLVIDFPAVFIPALLAVGMAVWASLTGCESHLVRAEAQRGE